MVKFIIFPEDIKQEDIKKKYSDIQFISTDNPQTAFAELGTKSYLMNFRYPVALIKIGEEEFMKKLFESGEVFMRSVAFFQELENDTNDCSDGRGDAYEGVDVVLQASELIVNDTSITNISPIRCKYSNNNDGLIYSTFGVFEDSMQDGNYSIPDDMRKMGDTAVIIYQPQIFIDRCTAYVKNIGGKLMARSVTYYDENVGNISMSPWLKRKKFEYQSEYRLFIPCMNRAQLTLRLGSIEDIAKMIKWS